MKRFYTFLLSGFGAGWLPVAPGTWGAGVATLLLWPLTGVSPAAAVLILSTLILSFSWIGAMGSEKMAAEWGEDPKQTVIDEMVGQWIAVLGLPLQWQYWLAGFLLFRFFDIVKPLGIRRMEKLGQGWGVMLDDVVAGAYANVLLQVVCLFGFI